jgi:hypothetical protein
MDKQATRQQQLWKGWHVQTGVLWAHGEVLARRAPNVLWVKAQQMHSTFCACNAMPLTCYIDMLCQHAMRGALFHAAAPACKQLLCLSLLLSLLLTHYTSMLCTTHACANTYPTCSAHTADDVVYHWQLCTTHTIRSCSPGLPRRGCCTHHTIVCCSLHIPAQIHTPSVLHTQLMNWFTFGSCAPPNTVVPLTQVAQADCCTHHTIACWHYTRLHKTILPLLSTLT